MSLGIVERLAAVVGAAFFFGACSVTDVGNPENGHVDGGSGATVDVEVRFEGLRETPDPGALTLPEGTVIEEAWFGVTNLSLRGGADCDRRIGTVSRDLRVFDLFAADEDRLVRLPNQPVGDYCRLEFRLDQIPAVELPRDAPRDVGGNSVWIRGHRADGAPFVLRGEFEPLLSLARTNGAFRIGERGRKLLVSLVAENWIDREKLESIREERDRILICEEENSALLEDFRQVFPRTAYLIRDADGDGVSETSERDRILGKSVNDGTASAEPPPDAGIDAE